MPQLLSIVALCPVVTGASLAEDEGLCRKADRKDQHGVCGTGPQVDEGGAGHIAAGWSRCSTYRCAELKVEVIVGAGGVLLADWHRSGYRTGGLGRDACGPVRVGPGTWVDGRLTLWLLELRVGLARPGMDRQAGRVGRLTERRRPGTDKRRSGGN